MKRIAIVGYGYVGKAMYNLFRGRYDVYVHDPLIDCKAFPDVKFVDQDGVNACDLGVICVPTPWLRTPLVLLKSTVEIGTTDRLIAATGLHIVFSPEYCGESSYWSPYLFDRSIIETPFFIFGGHPADTSKMVDYFLSVTGPTKRYYQCTASEAEMAKYMENTFYALKISYCYEVYEICRRAGIDWNTVRELWLADPRINPMHTAVFVENTRPFSGKCLPKDTSALVAFAQRIGYEPELLKEVLKTNNRLAEERRRQANG